MTRMIQSKKTYQIKVDSFQKKINNHNINKKPCLIIYFTIIESIIILFLYYSLKRIHFKLYQLAKVKYI